MQWPLVAARPPAGAPLLPGACVLNPVPPGHYVYSPMCLYPQYLFPPPMYPCPVLPTPSPAPPPSQPNYLNPPLPNYPSQGMKVEDDLKFLKLQDLDKEKDVPIGRGVWVCGHRGLQKYEYVVGGTCILTPECCFYP